MTLRCPPQEMLCSVNVVPDGEGGQSARFQSVPEFGQLPIKRTRWRSRQKQTVMEPEPLAGVHRKDFRRGVRSFANSFRASVVRPAHRRFFDFTQLDVSQTGKSHHDDDADEVTCDDLNPICVPADLEQMGQKLFPFFEKRRSQVALLNAGPASESLDQSHHLPYAASGIGSLTGAVQCEPGQVG